MEVEKGRLRGEGREGVARNIEGCEVDAGLVVDICALSEGLAAP